MKLEEIRRMSSGLRLRVAATNSPIEFGGLLDICDALDGLLRVAEAAKHFKNWHFNTSCEILFAALAELEAP